MAKEYSRIPQNERDLESTNYVVKPEETRRRSCCISSFVVFAVIVTLLGAFALIVGIFFTPQVNTIIHNYWRPTGNSSLETISTSVLTNSSQSVNNASVDNTTARPVPKEIPKNLTAEASKPKVPPPNSTTVEEKEEDEAPKHYLEKNQTAKTNSTHGLIYRLTGSDLRIDEAEEEFASWMIKLERFLEKITGIQRAEFVVPLFMLLCFLTSLSLAGCCCWLMMKRRESQRRLILGRFITDLQTGDSKSILLGQDGDD